MAAGEIRMDEIIPDEMGNIPQPMNLRAHLFPDDSLGNCIPKIASEKRKILYLSDRDNKRIIRVDLDNWKAFRSPPMRGLPLVSYEFTVLDGLVFIVNMLGSSLLCWDSYVGPSTEVCKEDAFMSAAPSMSISIGWYCMKGSKWRRYVTSVEPNSCATVLVEA
ncbi:hypothetical protein FOL46_003189 [Perkinsus olseni]|uniref:Uncharacterized protein n=1 Tax=Perkinsus olseni TaxID=32597 RepID=A0A7J6M3V5_PEROL|nr:hypothetical protein FOL46_003189 [Perkinsus olseni]